MTQEEYEQRNIEVAMRPPNYSWHMSEKAKMLQNYSTKFSKSPYMFKNEKFLHEFTKKVRAARGLDENDVRQIWWVNEEESKGQAGAATKRTISRFKVVVFEGSARLNKFIEAEPAFVDEIETSSQGGSGVAKMAAAMGQKLVQKAGQLEGEKKGAQVKKNMKVRTVVDRTKRVNFSIKVPRAENGSVEDGLMLDFAFDNQTITN